MGSVPVTLDSWLASLKAAEVPVEGFTTSDVASALRISERTARERLRTACARGTVRWVGERVAMNMRGFPYRIPVYQYCKEVKVSSDKQIRALHPTVERKKSRKK